MDLQLALLQYMFLNSTVIKVYNHTFIDHNSHHLCIIITIFVQSIDYAAAIVMNRLAKALPLQAKRILSITSLCEAMLLSFRLFICFGWLLIYILVVRRSYRFCCCLPSTGIRRRCVWIPSSTWGHARRDLVLLLLAVE